MATSRKAEISLTSLSVDIHPIRSLVVSIGHPVHVGRASSNLTRNILPQKHNAIFEAPVVSRSHASFFMDETDNHIYIKDMDSSHGTYVNGQAIKGPVALHLGDSIVFGSDIRHRDHGLARSHVVQVSSLDYSSYKPNSYGHVDELPAYDTNSEQEDSAKGDFSVPSETLPALGKCIDSETSDDFSAIHAPLTSSVIHEKTSRDLSDGDSTESEYEELNQQVKGKETEVCGTPHTSPASAASAAPDSTQIKVCRIVNAIRDQDIQEANSMPSVQSLLSFDEVLAEPSTPFNFQSSPSSADKTLKNIDFQASVNRPNSSSSSISSHYLSSMEAQSKDYTITDSDLHKCNDILPFEPMPLDFKRASQARTSSIRWKPRVGTTHLGRTNIPGIHRFTKQPSISKGGANAKSTGTSPSPGSDLKQRLGRMHTMNRPRHTQTLPSSLIDGERISWQTLVDLASLMLNEHHSDSDSLSHGDLPISKVMAYWLTRDVYIRSDQETPTKNFLQSHWDFLLSDLKTQELKLENMLGRRDEISFGENIRLPEIVFELSVGQYLKDETLVEKSLNQLCSWEGIAFQPIYEKRLIPLLTHICTWSNAGIITKAAAYIQHYKTAIAPKIIKDSENEIIHAHRIPEIHKDPKQLSDVDSKKRKRELETIDIGASKNEYTIDVSTTTEGMILTEPPLKKRNVNAYIWTGVAGVLVGGIGTIAALIASANDTI